MIGERMIDEPPSNALLSKWQASKRFEGWLGF